MLRCSHVLYQNVRYRRPLGRASIRTIKFWRPPTRSRSDDAASLCETDLPVPDVVHVHVRLPRKWKPRAGQYIYLSVPGASRTSFAQLHPFYVAWRHRDRGNDYAVLIVQKQRGFSRRLFSRRGNDVDCASDMMALVEGPYGKELRLDLYGTVLLFATGIGIAGQLPYVEHLLTGYQNCEVKTRRIALFWEVESEIQTAWVADRMQMLLKSDTDRVLDIRIFILGDFLSPVETSRGDCKKLGKRISMRYDALPVEEVLHQELQRRKGQTVISLCTNTKMSGRIREAVRNTADDNISVKELDFQPPNNACRAKSIITI
ncbi:uncharacterized protein F4822DRAFT_435527 [Hypoxylon trugodes]|uniref:uncharacterized protein n=1 Tax=Hypoxylon trugodes TaxID=326681 RepID=UPI00219FE94B|nr:uncharacterized protein F4822DRAFT_435527 [Hypoxylon trugodes]KAI1382492.1 hypothetical protein F4822DRAFT_435527 [Hypoxylon trugodes]